MRRWCDSTERGQDMVEFALILPVLMLVLLGIFDMGRVTYYASVLHNAAREGARYSSLFPEDADGAIAAAESFAIGIPLDEFEVIVATYPVTIQVTTAYTMPFVTPLIGAFFSDENVIPLSSQATMHREY
jgi:Flp pilus assembly protein TadG